MSESIYEAYCVELDAIVTIEEAQEAYFAQEEPRTRFNFQCSDEKCRNLPTPPEITGVNYSSEEYKRTPHFRRNENYEHDENCYWGVYHAIQNEVLQNKEEYRNGSKKNILRTLLKLEPENAYDELIVPQEQPTTRQNETKNLTREEIQYNIIYKNHKTSSLEKVVDTFRTINTDQKKEFLLALPSPSRPASSYEQAFKLVYKAKRQNHFNSWLYIYYSAATVVRCNEPESGYRILFYNTKCRYDFEIIDKTYPITSNLFLDNSFTPHFKSQQLRKNLEYYYKTQEVFCCYILSNETHLKTVDVGGGVRKEAVVIEAQSSHPIVFREISPNCREQRNS